MPRQEIDLINEIIMGQETNTMRLLSNTVSTYPQEWIVIHEALQNAKDAVQKSSNERGTIDIEFDLTNQRVTVSDNGSGFPFNLELLGIGGTDKADEDWKIAGRIGVGLKAVLFSTNNFWVESVCEGKKWSMEIDDAYKYLTREEGKLVIDEPSDIEEECHTNVSYSFPTRYVSEFLEMIWECYGKYVSNDLAASPLEKLKFAIEWYFRSYSYAGDVNNLVGLSGIKPIDISVVFRFTGNKKDYLKDGLCDILGDNEVLNVDFTNKHWDIEEAANRIIKGVPRVYVFTVEVPDGGNIGNYNRNYVWTKK